MTQLNTAEDRDLDAPRWGAKAIAEVVGTTERKAFYLLERGYLDASKVGTQWVSTPRRLRRSLGAGE